jgi:hypothetical protein
LPEVRDRQTVDRQHDVEIVGEEDKGNLSWFK